MKKATLTFLFTAIAIIGFAQKDTTAKTTPPEKEFVYERTDTAVVRVLTYEGTDGNVKWFSPAYILLKGYAVKRLKPITITTGGKLTENDYQWQWTEQPKTEAVFDGKRNRLDLKKVIQVIQ